MAQMKKSMLVAAVVLAAALTPAEAQRAPYGSGPGGYGQQQQQSRHVAGKFDYYVLALSWSPTFCASDTSGRNEQQCNPRSGKRYSFVLHGLWPQYEKGWPNDCQTQERPFVPNPIIDRMLDIMPARGLIIHQYKKHGTCSGLSPEGYFETSRRMFTKVKIPTRFDAPQAPQFVGPGDVIKEFVAANPGMPEGAIAVSCGGPGDRLREVRICLTRDGAYRNCGSNENQRRMCSAQRMYVPPVRPSAAPSAPRPGGPGGQKI